MEVEARRFARRILILHLTLLIAVLLLVALASGEIYSSTRAQILNQARERQTLLTSQTVRGIESFYDSILENLDLLRRAENEEATTERSPSTDPFIGAMSAAASPLRDRPLLARNFARQATTQPETPPAGRAAPIGSRGAVVGQIMWRQLQGRVSLLFGVDASTLNHPAPPTRVIGSDDPALTPQQVIEQARSWLQTVREPAVSPFQIFPGGGANLVCIPYPHDRLVVAVVPIAAIESTFLKPLNDDPDTGAWLVDQRMTAMAASRPQLAGANMSEISDAQFRAVATDDVQQQRSATTVVPRSFTLGSARLIPSMVSATPVHIADKSWELFIATSMAQVDDVVARLFHRTLFWGIFLVLSMTAILVSTAWQMIRNRIRIERVRHDLLTKELSQARDIQLAWLPDALPHRAEIDIAAINSPASHISGDFYNWFELPGGKLVVTIGDVTGHGMSAAFLMATTQLLVRNTMPRVGDPAKCLEEVNRQLCVQMFNGQFVTMLIVVLDIQAGQMQIATAGHPSPLLAEDDRFVPLRLEPQIVLGVERDAVFHTEKFPIPTKACLLLYTDGVVDCTNPAGARFTATDLKTTLRINRPASAQAVIDRIIQSINAFRGHSPLSDDLTMVAIQLHMPGGHRTLVHSATADV